jgi:hypothetical protein
MGIGIGVGTEVLFVIREEVGRDVSIWKVAPYNYRYGEEEGLWVSFPRIGFWFEFE